MRKKLCLLVMMMSVFTLSAQVYVTPEVGMTAFKTQGGLEKRWKAGWKAGAAVEYKFKSGIFSLQSGAYYANRASDNIVYPTIDADNKIMTAMLSNTNNHYLQIPLLAKFNVRLTDDISISAAVGPYIGISLANTGKNHATTVKYDELQSGYYWIGDSHHYYFEYNEYGYGGGGQISNSNKDGIFQSYAWDQNYKLDNDYGAMLKVGLDVRNFVIGLAYDLSFRKTSGWSGDNSIVEYQTFNVSLGYKFKLTK